MSSHTPPNSTALAPSGADGGVSLLEAAPSPSPIANFGFSDNERQSAGQLQGRPHCHPPGLRLVAVQAHGCRRPFVQVTDISSGKLTFTPAANSLASANFTFQVQDTGLSQAGSTGVDLDQLPNTLTFTSPALTTHRRGRPGDSRLQRRQQLHAENFRFRLHHRTTRQTTASPASFSPRCPPMALCSALLRTSPPPASLLPSAIQPTA